MKNELEYIDMLEKCGLGSTPNRLAVLAIVAKSSSPLTAQEVFETLNRTKGINRVTVYRILELLVDIKLLERLSGGDRSFRYGMGVNANNLEHPHFFCTKCGNMECLNPGTLDFNIDDFQKTFTGKVERVEIRIDGICKNCLRKI
ncbi:Ferric uptake regulator family protein [Desulfonema limicola]|uniref:Ferric uptake regulator family protein n=1 Tax=Desulfonema limicola TaxID=45656 RepID=A0A975GHZ0_9BACT|nr:Fur family transcriptional regulator [Desulfonema limicola]QTA81957.1 Ferric uptake regulator family protein [Desulfonema limicola]